MFVLSHNFSPLDKANQPLVLLLMRCRPIVGQESFYLLLLPFGMKNDKDCDVYEYGIIIRE